VRPAIRWAPKLPVSMIVRLYKLDAEGRHDHDLADDVGWRLLARCQDVLHVTDSEVACPSCGTVFAVAWVGEPGDRVSACPACGWSVTALEYRESVGHRDLDAAGARHAFAEYVERFPRLKTYEEKLLAIDRVVHSVHRTGNLAARNLFEGRAKQVLAQLDELAGREG
jgi:hypothetical protein